MFTDFHRQKGSIHGVKAICKRCAAKYKKKYRRRELHKQFRSIMPDIIIKYDLFSYCPTPINYNLSGSGVYEIIFPDEKRYIGKSFNYKKRITDHKKCAKTLDTKLYRAIRDFGWKNIIFNQLVQCSDPYDLSVLENFYILYFKSIKNGYNSYMGTIYKKETNKSVKFKGAIYDSLNEIGSVFYIHPLTIHKIFNPSTFKAVKPNEIEF